MVKRIIFKAKFHYYTKFINRLVNYLVFLLRNDIVNQNNYDKKMDSHLRAIALKKLFPKISKQISTLEVDSEFLTELTAKISSNTHEKIEQIKKEYSLYFDVLANLPDKYFEDDIEFKELYSIIEIRQKFDNIKIKVLRTLRRKYQKEINRLQKPISERNAVKFHVKFEYFSKALTIGTPILLIGGIFKQYIISRDFSFALPTVFSLNDYISASIDTLLFAIISTLIFTVSSYIGRLEDSRNDSIFNKRDKKDDLFLYLNSLLIFSTTIFTYFKNRIAFYIILPLAGLYLMFIILPKLLNRYLMYDYNVIVLIFSIMCFYLNIYSYTKSESYKIKSNEVEKHYKFELSENIKDIKDLRYVTSGANYYVFWDAKDSSTVLIKRESIERIIIK